MSVARIITESPEHCEELLRQLTSAGYTVRFAAPDEEFDDADLVVSAATVHADYALQYAAEVAQVSGGQVIVARGVVPGSETAAVEPVAAAQQAAPEPSESFADRLSGLKCRMQGRWQDIRHERALSREQKRLERERQAMEDEERRQEELRARSAEESRRSAERERLRMERQARDAEAQRVAEERRAQVEAERERIAAEAARLAAEREQIRLAMLAEEDTRRREDEAERERRAMQAQPVPAQEIAPEYVPAPVAEVEAAPPIAVRPIAPQRPIAVKRRATRRYGLQRAVVAASIVALVLMIVFAIAINSGPRNPIPNGVANSTVEEESPFGPARSGPVATPPVVHAAAPGATTSRPATTTPSKPAAAHPSRRTRRSDDSDVAQDEVIIHHYGPQKHPQSTHTRAGIPHYSDQE